jgi:hypothetical protein
MTYQFQVLTGLTQIGTIDRITVGEIDTNILTANEFIYPNGAIDGYVLTSNPAGVASWQPDSTVLNGDAMGAPLTNRVDTLAGGTIDILSLVTLLGAQTVKNKLLGLTNVLSLSGDVGGTSPSTVVSFVGGSTNVHQAELLANASTDANGANVIVRRNGGNSSAGTITVTLNGNASTVTTNANLTGMVTFVGNAATVVTNANLSGDITSVGNVTTAGATIVKTTATQTLTNTTLTLPIISSISNSGTVTLPTGTRTLTARDTTDTLTNKTITDTTNSVDADTIRNGATWAVAFGGAAPTTNQVMQFNGSNADWSTSSSTGVSTATANTLCLRDANADCAVRDITLRRVVDTSGYIILDTFSGAQSLLVGRRVGNQTFTGLNNVCVGFSTGGTLSSGSNITAIGAAVVFARQIVPLVLSRDRVSVGE